MFIYHHGPDPSCISHGGQLHRRRAQHDRRGLGRWRDGVFARTDDDQNDSGRRRDETRGKPASRSTRNMTRAMGWDRHFVLLSQGFQVTAENADAADRPTQAAISASWIIPRSRKHEIGLLYMYTVRRFCSRLLPCRSASQADPWRVSGLQVVQPQRDTATRDDNPTCFVPQTQPPTFFRPRFGGGLASVDPIRGRPGPGTGSGAARETPRRW